MKMRFGCMYFDLRPVVVLMFEYIHIGMLVLSRFVL